MLVMAIQGPLRKAGFLLTASISHPAKPLSFLCDCALPVERRGPLPCPLDVGWLGDLLWLGAGCGTRDVRHPNPGCQRRAAPLALCGAPM